jgi:hypothetical protein
MQFHERVYDIYAILGGPRADPPWTTLCWSAVTSTLEPLFMRARGRPSVRTSQLGGRLGSMKPISFGRLGNNRESADKWTHSKDGFLLSGQSALYGSTEIWAPIWTVCSRERKAPDVYFGMANAKSGANDETDALVPYTSICILAAAGDLGEETVALTLLVAKRLSNELAAILTATCTRSWGVASAPGSNMFNNAINDMPNRSLFRNGLPRMQIPTVKDLEGEWHSVI